jgi:hypothetical protein
MRAALALALMMAGCSGAGPPGPVLLDQHGEPLTVDAGTPDAGAPIDGGGTIVRDERGICWQVETRECEPGVPCQPPPPRRVLCPDR